MAVFDKEVSKKVNLDDTEALTVTIENAQNVNGHTEYIIKVQRGPNATKSWSICKRYSDFVTLHGTIQGSGINILLPPKKLIGNMDRNFIAKRQIELENYLTAILMNPILASCLSVKKFLDPNNYGKPLQELALQQVSMALRSEFNLEFVKAAPEIGWRLRKHYFFVKSKLKPKSEMLLQWVEYGPDKYLEEKELQSILKYLVSLDHPHIEKIEFAHCGYGGCFTVRQFYPCGTLRDIIYGTKPKSTFLKKYGNPKHSNPLNVNDISLFGRQIMEAIKFLREKGIPYGHIHLGNILVVDNNIKLLDIENTIFGLSSFYRPFFVQFKKINLIETIDIYSLGHVFFEMAFGYPLQKAVCDNIPMTSPSLHSVLDSILSPNSCKSGLPTLEELLQHPFFCTSYNDQGPKINFKLNNSLRDSLKKATKSVEKRLQDEQKLIRYKKKLVKMKDILTSECLTVEMKTKQKEGKSTNQKLSEISVESESKSPRSSSLTSNSTAASAGTMTPPLSVNKMQTSESNNLSSDSDNRSALLNSICSFDKSGLRHRSTPVNSSACS